MSDGLFIETETPDHVRFSMTPDLWSLIDEVTRGVPHEDNTASDVDAPRHGPNERFNGCIARDQTGGSLNLEVLQRPP